MKKPQQNISSFNKKKLTKLLPTNKRERYLDPKTTGLTLTVYPSGRKSFVLIRKVDAQTGSKVIGLFPDMTIEQARAKAVKLNAEIAQGKNPFKTQSKDHHEWTLDELFDLFIERYAKLHKKTWKDDVKQYNLYLRDWNGKRKITLIKKIDIQRLHAKLGAESGLYAANRALALIHTLYNRAIEWGWEHTNPAHGIKKFKEKSRERFLQADELKRFFESVAIESSGIVRDYVLISLLTGFE